MYCSVVQFAPGSLLAAGYGKTSPANLETFAIFAFMVAWVVSLSLPALCQNRCASVRASEPLQSWEAKIAEVLRQLLQARTATGWNTGLRTNCLNNFAILVSLVTCLLLFLLDQK